MQTLAQLADSFQLYGVCEHCRRVAEIDLDKLMASEGADYTLDRVRMRLWCTTCRQRSHSLRIVYVGPGRKSAAFRYRR